ncbi:MAG: hypothetical protein LCH56_10700 [Proteobacteria bacterium]|nr:hypothetical protein [Pseudomonadota bacterium]
MSVGVCEHCTQKFSYRLIHNGWSNTAYAYCDNCGCTALFHELGPVPTTARLKVQGRISGEIEQYLKPCACGGKFRAEAVPRCPHCRQALSPEKARGYLEANAAAGWSWQGNWSDFHCIVIAERSVDEPWLNAPAKFTYNDIVSVKPTVKVWSDVPGFVKRGPRIGEPASICGVSEGKPPQGFPEGVTYTIEFEGGDSIVVHQDDLDLVERFAP